MTKKDLSQCYYLRREIEHDEERLARLRAEALHPPTPVLSDEPPGPHNGESRTEKLVLEIIALEGEIEEKRLNRIRELARLEQYISTIDDSLTRLVFSYRHVDGLRWTEIARKIGGNNTPDSVRKLHDRYIEKN